MREFIPVHAGSRNRAESEQELPCEWIELPSSRHRIAGKVPLAGAIWRAILLVYQPGYLNILPLYIALVERD